ncbi:extracellular solute-binding protein [Muricomes sp. OA1]|uniref:Extracellular solute-binding protein n=3 Tax=Lachnospiraceae TaxID=186803 RepID=A0A3E2X1D2_9FIRM|nr:MULTISPECIES: extracellular solute-binding protein [Clostridia]MEE0201354.1 extracellular solute-binding protein [Muricomes sp.]MCH1971095.1 extracellular solute-binding protein [Muricomes sp. OA1]MRM88728.1 extracellular solute-binding protein [Faecalicatena contorta]RGC35088.1 extracellular solute-binding protein [Hungatella hathewayi]GKH34388.1 hypothetical protein CE91St64_37950 [Faecalicatena contorta]
MKKRMRRIIACLLSVSVLVGLCACGSGKKEEKAQGDIADAGYDIDAMEVEETTVKLYHRINADGGDAESEYFIDKVNEWNESNNGITIEPIFIMKENDYLDRLSTDLASGDAPDIFMQYGGTNCLDYVESDIVLNLEPYFEADPDWYNGIVKANWNMVDYGRYGHEGLYGAPWSAFELLLYYNEEYLDKCNLEVPKSWEELVNCCEVLKNNGYQPFMVGESDNYRYGHLLSAMAVKSYGPDFENELAERKFTYESPEIVSLIQEIKNMQDKGYFGENVLSVDVNAERSYFGAGDCAFMIDLSRGGALLSDSECFKKQTIHATKIPYFDAQYETANMGGASQNYFICTMNKSVNQIKASLKVVKWLTSQEFVDGLVKEYANTYSVIPSEGIIDNYMFEECNELMSQTEAYVAELAQASTNTAELTVVRNALQLLGSGSSAEEVSKEIMDNLANYE